MASLYSGALSLKPEDAQVIISGSFTITLTSKTVATWDANTTIFTGKAEISCTVLNRPEDADDGLIAVRAYVVNIDSEEWLGKQKVVSGSGHLGLDVDNKIISLHFDGHDIRVVKEAPSDIGVVKGFLFGQIVGSVEVADGVIGAKDSPRIQSTKNTSIVCLDVDFLRGKENPYQSVLLLPLPSEMVQKALHRFRPGMIGQFEVELIQLGFNQQTDTAVFLPYVARVVPTSWLRIMPSAPPLPTSVTSKGSHSEGRKRVLDLSSSPGPEDAGAKGKDVPDAKKQKVIERPAPAVAPAVKTEEDAPQGPVPSGSK